MFWEKGIHEYNSLLTETSTKHCANTLDSIYMKLFTYKRSRTQTEEFFKSVVKESFIWGRVFKELAG